MNYKHAYAGLLRGTLRFSFAFIEGKWKALKAAIRRYAILVHWQSIPVDTPNEFRPDGAIRNSSQECILWGAFLGLFMGLMASASFSVMKSEFLSIGALFAIGGSFGALQGAWIGKLMFWILRDMDRLGFFRPKDSH